MFPTLLNIDSLLSQILSQRHRQDRDVRQRAEQPDSRFWVYFQREVKEELGSHIQNKSQIPQFNISQAEQQVGQDQLPHDGRVDNSHFPSLQQQSEREEAEDQKGKGGSGQFPKHETDLIKLV